MEQITLGQIVTFLGCVAGLITSCTVIYKAMTKFMKTWITQAFKEEFEPFKKTVDELQKHIDDVDVESCKNHLITFLSSVERGEAVQEIELERFWEEYNHYREKGGNSYVERKVEQLKAKGWL